MNYDSYLMFSFASHIFYQGHVNYKKICSHKNRRKSNHKYNDQWKNSTSKFSDERHLVYLVGVKTLEPDFQNSKNFSTFWLCDLNKLFKLNTSLLLL